MRPSTHRKRPQRQRSERPVLYAPPPPPPEMGDKPKPEEETSERGVCVVDFFI